jgi:LppX_LprAFG lipoprotein
MSRAVALVVAGLVALLVAGCGSSSTAQPPVAAATLLHEAKATVDASHSAHFSLASRGVSTDGTAITSGEGDIVRPDQMRGSFTVAIKGFDASVKVVASGGVFEALLPFQTRYSVTEPSTYGLQNPAQLLDPTRGLSNLLIVGKDPRLTGQERIAGELLEEVTSTVPGTVIPVLPDANPSQPVTLVAAIDPGSHQVRQMVLTGPFTSASRNSTFDVTLTNYGEAVTITLPPA